MAESTSDLPVVEGFRRWAPTYEAETALTVFEARLFQSLGLETAGRSVLDAACGTGRRLRDASGATLAVGVDLVREMLLASGPPGLKRLVQADVRRLPFANDAFDLAWCRLALGFVPDLHAAVHELARVIREDGCLALTELHPEVVSPRGRRAFRDADGRAWSIQENVRTLEAHKSAVRAAGLRLVRVVELTVQSEDKGIFESYGGADLHAGLIGRAVVFGLLAAKR